MKRWLFLFNNGNWYQARVLFKLKKKKNSALRKETWPAYKNINKYCY